MKKNVMAADCTAYAYGDFHNKFIKNKIILSCGGIENAVKTST
jgi:hypothetical protein